MKTVGARGYAWWSLALGLVALLFAARFGATWLSFLVGVLLVTGTFWTARASTRATDQSDAGKATRWRRGVGIALGCLALPLVLIAHPSINWALLNRVLEPSYEVLLRTEPIPGVAPSRNAMDETRDILASRLRASDIPFDIEVEDSTGIRVTLSLWGEFDLDRLPTLLQTSGVSFHIEHSDTSLVARVDVEPSLVPEGYEIATVAQQSVVYESQPVLFDGVQDAAAGTDPQFDVPEIYIAFDPSAAAVLSEVTAENIGRRLVIMLDSHVLSAPVVRDRLGRRVVIQLGREGTLAQAHDIAVVLGTGPLPIALRIAEEGPITSETR